MKRQSFAMNFAAAGESFDTPTANEATSPRAGLRHEICAPLSMGPRCIRNALARLADTRAQARGDLPDDSVVRLVPADDAPPHADS
jgi:hypothetical protein